MTFFLKKEEIFEVKRGLEPRFNRHPNNPQLRICGAPLEFFTVANSGRVRAPQFEPQNGREIGKKFGAWSFFVSKIPVGWGFRRPLNWSVISRPRQLAPHRPIF